MHTVRDGHLQCIGGHGGMHCVENVRSWVRGVECRFEYC